MQCNPFPSGGPIQVGEADWRSHRGGVVVQGRPSDDQRVKRVCVGQGLESTQVEVREEWNILD